jgi:hypothetical protein
MQTQEKSPRERNQENWYNRIAEYLSKGITQDAYCEMRGFKKGTFSYWLNKYRSSQDTIVKPANGFIAIQPLADPINESKIVLQTGAVELILPRGYCELERLVPLIKALR